MSPQVDHLFDLRSDLNPIVGRLARQLKSSLKDDPDLIDTSSFRIVERMLEFAAAAEQRIVEQSQRISYLEALSVTDELTGLLNRRGFTEVLDRTLSNARRYEESGLLVYLDLDGFKQINDDYGHDAGDAVLQKIADILRDNTRTTDYVARLGGDEFAALLVRCDQRTANVRLLYLSDFINASELSLGDVTLPIRGSLGVAPYGPETDPADLVRAADAAMYRSKRAAQAERALDGPALKLLQAG